ncbi:MAG: MMPL family transporter [Rhizobiales bacterium]|nr:MMPL family transporter [Hyphomicrobiales bacterium]
MVWDKSYTHHIAKVLALLAGNAARRAPLIVGGYVVLALVALAIAVTQLEINTNTNEMIAKDLPFRQDFAELNRSFPALGDNFIAVVEADDPETAREAAKSLVISFAGRPDIFKHIYSPGVSAFFDQHAFLYMPQARFNSIADRVQRAAPLLQAIVAEPSLPGLAGLVGGLAARGAKDLSPDFAEFLGSVQSVVAAQIGGRSRALDWQAVLGEEKAEAADTNIKLGPARHYVFVQPVLDFSALEPAKLAITAAQRLASDPEVTRSGQVKVSFTGEAAMSSEELRTVADGASLAGILSLILVACVLIFGVRSWRLVVAALSMLVVGLMLTAGFAALSIGHLNLISIAFGVLFVGLGIDFAIHFALRFEEERALPGHAAEVLEDVAAMTGPALLLCTATTTLAFLAFAPTDFAGMAQLGVISAGGMAIAFLLSMTLLPALLALMPGNPGKPTYPLLAWNLGAPGYGVRKYLTIVVLVAGIAAMYVAPSAVFEGDPIALKDPEASAVKVFKALKNDREAPSYVAELVVKNATEARIMASRLKDVFEVRDVISALSFIPGDQAQRTARLRNLRSIIPEPKSNQLPDRGEDARKKALAGLKKSLAGLERNKSAPAEVRKAAQQLRRTIDIYSNAEPRSAQDDRVLELSLFGDLWPTLNTFIEKLDAERITVDTLDAGLRSRYLSEDGKYRLDILPRAAITDDLTMRRFVTAVKDVAPHATGAPVEIVGGADVVAGAMLQATGVAALLIAIVLFGALRRIGDVLLVLLPIGLAGVLLIATTVIFGIPFNFANVIVLPLLIGLGVDSGIHLVMRTREEIAAGHQAELLETSTPRAVLLSALTTIASFGSLAVSNHRGTASMGELLTIAIVLTLVCTLIVLPTLVDWFLRPRHRRSFGG